MVTWALDLDGVMWRGHRAIAGSADAVARLTGAGHRVVYCTNNSSERIGHYVERLVEMGCRDTTDDDVVSSAVAVGTLVRPGERVLLCAGDGAAEALSSAGAELVDASDGGGAAVDAVVVGFHRHFDYVRMTNAVRAVLSGARLVATNDDARYPASDGLAPGCGSILASIERGSGVTAVVAGKPYAPMAELIRDRFGDDGVFVGDTLATDGAMARELGWRFGLVLTGNTRAGAIPPEVDPAWVGADLASLVATVGRW